ncbi:hypothetical protein BDZ97DRAFT_1329114 [Flammula alnicola]|nr:hypothetical protein BDZ97DRAFT_1329114 [Flammula alnicola]
MGPLYSSPGLPPCIPLTSFANLMAVESLDMRSTAYSYIFPARPFDSPAPYFPRLKSLLSILHRLKFAACLTTLSASFPITIYSGDMQALFQLIYCVSRSLELLELYGINWPGLLHQYLEPHFLVGLVALRTLKLKANYIASVNNESSAMKLFLDTLTSVTAIQLQLTWIWAST